MRQNFEEPGKAAPVRILLLLNKQRLFAKSVEMTRGTWTHLHSHAALPSDSPWTRQARRKHTNVTSPARCLLTLRRFSRLFLQRSDLHLGEHRVLCGGFLFQTLRRRLLVTNMCNIHRISPRGLGVCLHFMSLILVVFRIITVVGNSHTMRRCVGPQGRAWVRALKSW